MSSCLLNKCVHFPYKIKGSHLLRFQNEEIAVKANCQALRRAVAKSVKSYNVLSAYNEVFFEQAPSSLNKRLRAATSCGEGLRRIPSLDFL